MIKNKDIFIFLMIVAILASFVAGGFVFNKELIDRNQELVEKNEGLILEVNKLRELEEEYIDFSLFWQAWKTIEEKFIGQIDHQEMVYGAIKGMVESLGDPYTVFFDPEEAKIFEEDVTGSFEGIGVEIGIRDDQLTIIAPLEGTPGQKAGLKSGDKIMEIDGNSTADLTTDQAVKLIRGSKGTEVALIIYREEWQETKEIRIIRDTIKIPSLKWELKDNDIAYLRIYQFSLKTDDDFRETAWQILNSPAEKIILDLRDNPGGYLEVAVDIAGWFLERGQVVVIEDFGEDEQEEDKVHKSTGPEKFLDYPIVILINQGSASGSEILAGALRDNRGIKLIGEKSFGKGTVQELTELGEASLKITIAKWLTPNGEVITDKGLEPDIKVELTEEDYQQEKDPQLDKAIEILKEM